MSAYIGIGSKAKAIKKQYLGVGGKAKRVFRAYIGVGGKAKEFFFDMDASYQTVEYIKATTAGPYIVLPITVQEGLKLDLEVGWEGTGNSSYLGATGTNNYRQRFRLHRKDGSLIRGEGELYVPHSNANVILAGTISGSDLVSCSIDFGDYGGTKAGSLTVDGDTYNFTRTALSDLGRPLYLFGWYGSTPTFEVGRYGSIVAYDKDDNLIMDFVPVVKRTGSVPGYFDLVSMQFYGNVGTGSFTPGPNV